jgi:hypothetical protein
MSRYNREITEERLDRTAFQIRRMLGMLQPDKDEHWINTAPDDSGKFTVAGCSVSIRSTLWILQTREFRPELRVYPVCRYSRCMSPAHTRRSVSRRWSKSHPLILALLRLGRLPEIPERLRPTAFASAPVDYHCQREGCGVLLFYDASLRLLVCRVCEFFTTPNNRAADASREESTNDAYGMLCAL